MSISPREVARQNGRIIYLELLVLVLSFFSLGTLCAELFLPLEPGTATLLARIDDVVCGIFLMDFVVHLWIAPSPRWFWRVGWIDLLSSIPMTPWLRWGRVFRVLRILRALRSFRTVGDKLRSDRASGTFVMVGLISLVAVLFATVAAYEFERGAPAANINSAGDALWWAFATITTIGYGDHYPVTAGGRIVAVALVIFGLSFFGTFTAYVSSFFPGKAHLKEESEIHHLLREVRLLREQIEQLKGQMMPPGDKATTTTPPLPPPLGRI